MKVVYLAGFLGLAVLLLPTVAQTPVYQNPNAPFERRIEDMISRMTLEEKISQLMNDSPAIDRLGIPAYNWWNESLHGVGRAGRATVFPQAIGIAATWDTDLMFRVATAVSDEARAKYHEFVRRGKRNIYQGLTFWTPNINLFRDPRWGRGMETYGEDPYLTGRLAIAFIKGMQGDDPRYFKTIATAKHFAVHSGPEPSRHTFNAVVTDRDLYETYLPHFEASVKEGGAFSVMCAYNSVDGEPACANSRLLEGILRKQWGFKGYVVSDCGAIGDIYLNHKYKADAEEGVAAAIKAGTDLNCGVEYGKVLEAVSNGRLSDSDVNQALRRLLFARFKLGMFDPPSRVTYAQIPYSVNESDAHRALALETARKSIVLLKNQENVLPLAKNLKTLAVIGPNAHDARVLLGNYNGIPKDPITPLEGIRRKLGFTGTRVLYARGTDLAENLPNFEVIPAAFLFNSNEINRRSGLIGDYFRSAAFDGSAHRPAELTYPNSGKLVGAIPVDPLPAFTRLDPQIDFYWADRAPRPDMNDDDFGVRWTGYLAPSVTGEYQLGAIGMNAYELYFEGQQIVRSNSIHGFNYQFAPVQMEAGKLYSIRLDYHEYVNDAGIQLVWALPPSSGEEEALAAAREADAVVMLLGLSPRLEGEEMKVPVKGFDGGDRVELGLPEVQEDLLKKVVALKKPVVLVLLNGSALAVNWAKNNVPAIVEAWYPGQEGGTAIADVLFGDYNPSGRLPVTFYESANQLPPFTDYRMKGKTYRFFTGQALYPFGFGLSYTTFVYRNLSVPRRVRTGDSFKVSVDVENTGTMSGEEVVQLYLKVGSSPEGPIHSLEGFQRVFLRPHERKSIEFTLQGKQFSRVSETGRRIVEPGKIQIFVGGGQPGTTELRTLTGTVEVVGVARTLDEGLTQR